MDHSRDFNYPSRNSRNMPNELTEKKSGKTLINKHPRICLHAKVCSKKMNRFNSQEAAKLDAVLASVNQLIKCLDIEFGDDCCDSNKLVTIGTQQESNTKSLIAKVKSGPTSGSLSSNEENVTGVSGHQQFNGADSTQYERHSINAHRSDINKVRMPAEENNLFIESNATFKEDNFHKVVEEAGKSFETNKSEKNNRTEKLALKKQMTTTLPELKSHRAVNKKPPSPKVTSLQLNQRLCEEELHSDADSSTVNKTSDEAVYSAEAEKEEIATFFASSQDNNWNVDNSECKAVLAVHTELSQAPFVHSFSDDDIFFAEKSNTSTTSFSEGQSKTSLYKQKNKRKTEINERLPSYKETHVAAIKAVLPKRKISKDKEPAELRKLRLKRSNRLSLQSKDSENSKKGFPLELQLPDSANICNENLKPAPTRKTFLSRHKKFNLNFRRSQSLDAKLLLELENKSPLQDSKLIKLSLKKNLTLSSPFISPVCTGSTGKSQQDSMRFFMSKSSPTSQDKASSFEVCRDFDVSMRTKMNTEVDSIQEPETRHFLNYYRDMDRERNTSGFITDGSEAKPIRIDLLQQDGSRFKYPPLSPTRHPLTGSHRVRTGELYSSVHPWTPTDSDGSFRDSQDSLDDHNNSPKTISGSRQRYSGRQYENFNEQNGVESVAKLANKIGKKKKLRKSLKKATTVPIPDSDEMGERLWSPTGDCTWSNLSGKRVDLDSTRLQSLSELESDALQKVSLGRLNEAEIGVAILVPKDESKTSRRKLSIKKKYGVHLSSKDKNKDKNHGHVFGIPLVDVVENDQLLRLQKSASFATSTELHTADVVNGSVSTMTSARVGSSLSSSSGSCSGSSSSIHNQVSLPYSNLDEGDNVSAPLRFLSKTVSSENLSSDEFTQIPACTDPDVFTNASSKEHCCQNQSQTPNSAALNASTASQPLRRRGAIAADSLDEIDPYQSQLLEALSLTVSGTTTNQRKEAKRSLLPPTMPSVPYVVEKCCDHIKKYGLDVTGIFRIAGSKKRVKQLREEFDRGIDVTIDEDYNPHDVAALLKEFFRDLPEALFTKELYPAFIQTAKLSKQERLSCLRYLLWLLPQSNRDTLHTLLNFLAVVAAHSETSVDQAGNKVPGNKMNGANLATIFGPNIMHRYKKSPQSGNDNHYQVQNLEKPEESTAVIKIVTDLIADQVQLFQVPKEEHDEMLRVLKETDPEAVDFLLRRKAANHMREKTRLIGSPTSPNSLKSRDLHDPSSGNGVEVVSKFIEPTNESKVKENDSPSSDSYVIGNKLQLHPGMRLSYRQATCGRNEAVESVYCDASTQLQFKRPSFKNIDRRAQPIADNPNAGEHQCNGNSQLEKSRDDSTLTAEASKLVDEKNQSGADSTTSVSVITQDQSISFTDDEILQIIGQKDEDSEIGNRSVVPMIQEFRCTDECCDNTKRNVTLKQAIEVPGEELECAHCKTNKLYFMKSALLRAGNSSDSGISVDYTNSNVVSPEMVNCQSRSCYQPQTERAPEIRNVDVVSPLNFRTMAQWRYNDTENNVIPDKSPENNTGVFNYPALNAEHGVSSYNSDKIYTLNKTDEINSEADEYVPILASTANHNNPIIKFDCQQDVSSQLQLHPSTVSAINAVLSPEMKKKVDSKQRPTPLVRKNVAMSDKQSSSTEFRPTPLPRKSLRNGSSQLNQQKNGSSAVSRSKLNVNLNKVKAGSANNVLASDPTEAQQPKDKNMTHPKPAIKGNRSHSVKSPQRANSSVAVLARRFSKEDLTLPTSLKPMPGSTWTSPGIVGNNNSNFRVFRQNNHPGCSTKDHKLVASTTTSGHLAWHLTGRDRNCSPETLV